jgi:hypothetical protein
VPFSVENYGTSFNGTTAGPGVVLGPASGPPTVDRFTIIRGEATGNAHDKRPDPERVQRRDPVGGIGRRERRRPLFGRACHVSGLRHARDHGEYDGRRFANGQAWAVLLDSGSYANQMAGGVTFVGRINIQLNTVQGNQSGGIKNAGAVPTGAGLVIANHL